MIPREYCNVPVEDHSPGQSISTFSGRYHDDCTGVPLFYPPHLPPQGYLPPTMMTPPQEINPPPLGYPCRWTLPSPCTSVLDSSADLTGHIVSRHLQDVHVCHWDGCVRQGLAFKARYKLVSHLRTHTGEKPFPCPYMGCEKSFGRTENLKIHKRTHTGERPFKCPFPGCIRAFNNGSDRRKHKAVHTTPQPYKCQVHGCTKAYTHPSTLRQHKKSHTTEERMMCPKENNSSSNNNSNNNSYSSNNSTNNSTLLSDNKFTQQIKTEPIDSRTPQVNSYHGYPFTTERNTSPFYNNINPLYYTGYMQPPQNVHAMTSLYATSSAPGKPSKEFPSILEPPRLENVQTTVDDPKTV